MSRAALRKTLRLFLSADLAGSTAYKQTCKPVEWQDTFKHFYRQLPAFVEEMQGVGRSGRLRFWKTVGDEIVFVADLDRLDQVAVCLGSFRKAVFSYRRELLEANTGIDIKCAGWTAGFPVGNLEVKLPVGDQSDYIGPAMDIGFRLVKAACPRQMLVSVELAWLLSHRKSANKPLIWLDNGMDLKGVGQGRLYPMIWLDNFSDDLIGDGKRELVLQEERVRRVDREKCSPVLLHDYCERWLSEAGPPFIRPFIPGDPVMKEEPPGYRDQYQEMLEQTQGGEALSNRAKGKLGRSGGMKADLIIQQMNSLKRTFQSKPKK